MEFEEVYRRYFRDVYLYVRGLTGRETLAEEVTQETFFRAMEALPRFRGECDLRVWLCQIAKNCCYTHLRREKRLADEPPPEGFCHQPPIEERVADREDALRIHQLLHRMKEPYKEVFTLRVFGELSFRQIGAVFGKTENWACVTYHRAKKMIQREMEE